jgi:hypothetical protein
VSQTDAGGSLWVTVAKVTKVIARIIVADAEDAERISRIHVRKEPNFGGTEGQNHRWDDSQKASTDCAEMVRNPTRFLCILQLFLCSPRGGLPFLGAVMA